MIRVIVSGALGRMGQEVTKTVASQNDMEIAALFDPVHGGEIVDVANQSFEVYDDLGKAISEVSADILVDFSRPDTAPDNVKVALKAGITPIVGTTGTSEDEWANIYEKYAEGNVGLFVAPNFTTGAVLMMQFAKQAAKFFPDAEVIEFHHNGKRDAPSGTAVMTATMINESREKASSAPGSETELKGFEGARGALVGSVPVHSVRSDGFVANQEVIFGSSGQTLTLHHMSHDRGSYMPGVLLAIRGMQDRSEFILGLEYLMGLADD